jgi:DHA1 family multidrug resistance protein-like MFS transporter
MLQRPTEGVLWRGRYLSSALRLMTRVKSISTTQALVVSTFFAGFGGGVVFPILPTLGAVLGISPLLVGLILSANRFTRIVANAPAGALVDRFGTRTPLVIGLFIEGVATLGYVAALQFSPAAAWFLGARVIWGIGSALVFATAYTIASDVSESGSRGTNMGIVRGGMTFGFPAGLVAGGIVSELASIPVAFGLAAGLALTAGGLAYATVPETHVSVQRPRIKPWAIDASPAVLTVGLVNFGVFFAYFGVLFATLVLFLDAHGIGIAGLDARGSSGVLMAVTVLSGSVCMFGGGKVSDVLERRVPILVGFLSVFLVGFLVLASVRGLAGALAACVLIGAGYGGTSGPMLALLADVTPDERMGRAMGTNNVLGDLGGGLGPLVSLPLVQTVGFPTLYAACAGVPLLAGGILLGGIYLQTGTINPGTDAAAVASADD